MSRVWDQMFADQPPPRSPEQSRSLLRRLRNVVDKEKYKRNFVHVTLNHPTPEEVEGFLSRRQLKRYREQLRVLYDNAPTPQICEPIPDSPRLFIPGHFYSISTTTHLFLGCVTSESGSMVTLGRPDAVTVALGFPPADPMTVAKDTILSYFKTKGGQSQLTGTRYILTSETPRQMKTNEDGSALAAYPVNLNSGRG